MEDTQYKKFLTVQRLSQITGKTLFECQNILDPYYDFYNKHGYITEALKVYDVENIDLESDNIDSLKLEVDNINFGMIQKTSFMILRCPSNLKATI